MSLSGKQVEMTRRADKARATAVAIEATEIRRIEKALLASGFMLATLLALLLICP